MESNKGEIVMYQPDETIRLEVRMEGETVWLSQAQMAELFGTGRQAITKHLQNIYECEELEKNATSSILELVRKEGKRNVKRKIEFYNLDAIISVGFRVNTKRGIEFRQWANKVLKEYLLRGYVVNITPNRGSFLRRADLRCLRAYRQSHQTGKTIHRADRQLHRRDYADHA